MKSIFAIAVFLAVLLPVHSFADDTSKGASVLGVEMMFWDSIKDSKSIEELEAYLKDYPKGKFASIAKIRITALKREASQPAPPAAQTVPPTPLAAQTAQPPPAPVVVVPMALVKGACFVMGNTFDEGGEDEEPAHKVCLENFHMDKYHVTQSAYEAKTGKNPSRFGGCPNCPVEMVSWDEANSYCASIGGRLPTEAEWEYAARDGGKKIKYGTGKNEIAPGDANYQDSGLLKTSPVGGYPPNALGLHDMAGNVFAWVADLYDGGYYASSPKDNPKGPANGNAHVLRGGSWNRNAYGLRAASRIYGAPDFRDADTGFRCAK